MAISLFSSSLPLIKDWRTPAAIVGCGCLIALISFGPRSSLGFFLTPQSQANGWGRDVFGLALAVQNILWGLGQPLAGMLADRFGIVRVLCAGGIFYALGLAIMAFVWWLAILLGFLSALINLPIVEKPLPRLSAAPA
jgi:MFS family permease